MAKENISYDSHSGTLVCCGDWTIATLASLKTFLSGISIPTKREIIFNGEAIDKMDSAGAWLLVRWQKQFDAQKVQVHLQNFSDNHRKLIDMIAKQVTEDMSLPPVKIPSWLEKIGKQAIEQYQFLLAYLSFIGQLTLEAKRVVLQPKHFRLKPILGALYRTGYQALPIIALLSFMIGVVITYQMGLQLKNYGANIYIVDLLGLSILREFAPLITAIMVAGRTGSAFTAQIGMMKINQEIDALDTMGVTSAELLILPRIAALLVALPLLTMWSNIFGVFGGMVMANNMLSITWYDFLRRFPHVIPLRTLLLGLGKTPIFALIIASIGCFEGMRVTGSADSVGRNTTRSVVLSIFFIIVADAIFSILFSKMKL